MQFSKQLVQTAKLSW